MKKFCLWAVIALLFSVSLSAAPAIISVAPAVGPVDGGTEVIITGTEFTGATDVNFGSIPADSFNVDSDTQITAISPVHVPQVVPITVTTPSGTSPETNASFYVFQGTASVYVLNNINDGAVSVVDTGTDTIKASIMVGEKPQAVAITSDGAKALVGSTELGVLIINVADGTILATLAITDVPIAIAIMPDDSKAYVAGENFDIIVIDVQTNTIITTISPGLGGFSGVAMVPDGSKVYINSLSGQAIDIVDTATDTEISSSLTVPALLLLTPDGTKLLVGTDNAGIVYIDAVTNTIIDSTPISGRPFGGAVTFDGTKAYFSNLDATGVTVIDVVNNTLLTTIPVGMETSTVAITPDGTQVYVTAASGGTAFVIDIATDTVVGTVPIGADVTGIAIDPGQAKAYVTNADDADITVIDISTATVKTTIDVTSNPGPLAITPDQAPLAKFAITANGLEVTFDASASASPIGTITDYSWDFGDGDTVSTASSSIIHEYESAGNYVVTLTVTNSAGTSTEVVFRPLASSNDVFNNASIALNGGPTATTFQEITVAEQIFPPQNFKAKRVKNVFLDRSRVVAVLTWNAPSEGVPPGSYRIYRNAALTDLAGIVSANAILEFVDTRPGHTCEYFIVSVDSEGSTSAAASAFVRPKCT